MTARGSGRRKLERRDPFHQKKSLGQVFLNTNWPVVRMCERLNELRIERVIEIGPGNGILTRALLMAGMRVTAVEKDDRFAERMRGFGETMPEEVRSRFTILNEDILGFDWGAWAREPAFRHLRSAVVGNIPYNISSQIILRGLEHLTELKALVFMTQLEFAARVAARPNTKDFGSLTVFTQLRAEPYLEFKVPRTCFTPVPKVDSAVISIIPRPSQWSQAVLERAEQVTRIAFQQRRKKLRNSVRPFMDAGTAAGGLPLSEEGCPIDLDRRADSLAPREFIELAEFLLAPSGVQGS